MIKINFPEGVYTDEQVTRMWQDDTTGNVDNMTLARLTRCQDAVIRSESGFIVKETKDIADGDKGALSPSMMKWGADAVRAYLASCGWAEEDVPDPVCGVNLSIAAWQRSSCRGWSDISESLARVERWSEHLDKLISYDVDGDCPLVLILNARRNLKNAVEALQGNSDYGPDDKERGSLYDIGYSLAYGWDDDAEKWIRDDLKKFHEKVDGEIRAVMKNG